MSHAQKILSVSVLTRSMDPLQATIEIETSNGGVSFELNDEIAHNLCVRLEHFLTRERPLARAALR